MKQNCTTGKSGSKSSKKAPKGDGEGRGTAGTPHSALCRGCFCSGECGTAALAGGRRGVAVF